MMNRLLGGWVAAGALGYLIVFIAGRRSRFEELRPTLGILLASVAAGPLLIATLLWIAITGTWRRKSANAAPVPDGAISSREDLLCRMIDIRLAVAPERSMPKRAEQWMMWQLQQTPEADLAHAVDRFLWQGDGVSPLVSSDEPPVLEPALRDSLFAFCAAEMKATSPSYLNLDREVFMRAVELAAQWSLQQIRKAASGKPYPPASWWTEQLSWETIRNGDNDFGVRLRNLESGTTRTASDWRTLTGRRSETDQIWSFRSPPESWQHLAGRDGLVLARRGIPIASVTLLIN